jgi:hypothetical protein
MARRMEREKREGILDIEEGLEGVDDEWRCDEWEVME